MSEQIKISVASDLHLECYKDWQSKIPLFDQDSDVIVLAGDILTGDRLYSGVREVAKAKAHPHSEVVIVAGNHEYYESEYTDRLTEMRSEFVKVEPLQISGNY